MIQIEDYDTPMQAAEKLISGTMEVDKIHRDMFDLEELKEIAGYLLVYYNAHKEGANNEQ